MAHTPGPWATVDAEWLISQRSGMGYRYFPVRATGQTWDIANVFADEDDPEMVANARLIAAAPELLAVCSAIASDLSLLQFTNGEYRLSEQSAGVILQSLRQAIAKAEGRE